MVEFRSVSVQADGMEHLTEAARQAEREWDAARKAGRYFTGIRISCKHKHLAWRVMRRMKTGHRSFLNETLNL